MNPTISQSRSVCGVVKTKVGANEFDIPEIESKLYYKLQSGAKVQLAYHDDEIVGFMLYHEIYDCVLVIHNMFTSPKYFNNSMGAGMINSLKKPIKKVLFQSRKNNSPSQMLKVTKNWREKLSENEDMITWEMKWEYK